MSSNSKKTLRAHEQWAVAVAAAAIVSPLVSLGFTTSALDSSIAHAWWWQLIGTMGASLVLRVAVGVWLYSTARRDGNSPIVWFAMGTVFSLLAAILYFVLRILDRDAASTAQPVGPAT